MHRFPVGVFDSDIGGLSVVDQIRKMCPWEDIIYFADTLHYPFGTKTSEEVISYFKNAMDFFISKKVKAVLCACSTASCVSHPYFDHYFR